MDETTKERLVRTVRQYGPDGNSVAKVETVAVEIVWPDGKPKGSRNYVDCGSWRVAEDDS